MSTHNICFHGEIRKFIPVLSQNTPPKQFPFTISTQTERPGQFRSDQMPHSAAFDLGLHLCFTSSIL